MIYLMRKFYSSGLIFTWITFIVIALDRLSKLWVMTNLEVLQPLKILPIFNLTLVYNKGAAFSFLSQVSGWQNILLGSFAVFVSGLVIIWLAKSSSREYWSNTALALILGGALGNVTDRVLYGSVTDFLDFHLGEWHFAIFNIADSAISIGAFMIFVQWVFNRAD